MPHPEGLETGEYAKLLEARMKNQADVIEQTRQDLSEEKDRARQIILKNRLKLEQVELEGIEDELEMLTVKS